MPILIYDIKQNEIFDLSKVTYIDAAAKHHMSYKLYYKFRDGEVNETCNHLRITPERIEVWKKVCNGEQANEI